MNPMIKHGSFRICKSNKNLDRPRSEATRTMSTCVSVGVHAPGESGQGMLFRTNKPSELWGVQTRERAIKLPKMRKAA